MSWLDRVLERKSPEPWLMEKACPPIRYRLWTEVLGRPPQDPEARRALDECLSYKPPVTILRQQDFQGTWRNKVLDFEAPNPARNRGPGLVNQYLALVEYGWDSEHPALHASGELLERYLIRDRGVDLFELKGYAGSNKKVDAAIREELSFIALGLLSRAGYAEKASVVTRAEELRDLLLATFDEDGAADLFDGVVEVTETVRTPEGEVEQMHRFRRLRPEARCPDMFTYYALAFHPLFHEGPGLEAARRITRHLMRGDEIPERVREVEGKRFLFQRDLNIGWCERVFFEEGSIGYLLHDLELLARCGVLEEHPRAVELLEWLLSGHEVDGEEGMIRLEEATGKPTRPSRSLYHYFPLEDSWRGKHKKYTDVTFRTLAILACLDARRG